MNIAYDKNAVSGSAEFKYTPLEKGGILFVFYYFGNTNAILTVSRNGSVEKVFESGGTDYINNVTVVNSQIKISKQFAYMYFYTK